MTNNNNGYASGIFVRGAEDCRTQYLYKVRDAYIARGWNDGDLLAGGSACYDGLGLLLLLHGSLVRLHGVRNRLYPYPSSVIDNIGVFRYMWSTYLQ